MLPSTKWDSMTLSWWSHSTNVLCDLKSTMVQHFTDQQTRFILTKLILSRTSTSLANSDPPLSRLYVLKQAFSLYNINRCLTKSISHPSSSFVENTKIVSSHSRFITLSKLPSLYKRSFFISKLAKKISGIDQLPFISQICFKKSPFINFQNSMKPPFRTNSFTS